MIQSFAGEVARDIFWEPQHALLKATAHGFVAGRTEKAIGP